MIINSITLKNFRSYEDETTFNFTPIDGKNIILIGGENGAGKSTLFEAIKLCIYGPTNYGYIGENYNYLNKIKNNINDNAFKNEEVNAYISLDITFKDKTELKKHTLRRSWDYVKQKLHETFTIYLDGCELNTEEKVYFDKYLRSVLPPSLFNFFFFDGEELNEFFTSSTSNLSLKNSVLQLFNYDTFDILKKQLISYQRNNSKSNNKLNEIQQNYDELSSSVSTLNNEIESLNTTKENLNEELNNLHVKKIKIDEDFKNSGGLLDEERNKIQTKINLLENERININQSIKDFCNDTLSFLIVNNLLKSIKTQIKNEDLLNSYLSINDKLTTELIKSSIEEQINLDKDNKAYELIASSIKNKMFDMNIINNTENILQLSYEDKNSIQYLVNNTLNKRDKYKDETTSKYNRIKEVGLELKKLREKLNSTVSDDILNSYLESISNINNQIQDTERSLMNTENTINKKSEELKNKEYHLTRAKNEYTALLQNNNVLEISNNLIDYLEDLLSTLTSDKIKIIENQFIDIFKTIIRKDNYINSISIDDNFNTTLYINKDYSVNEIINIINNIGFNEISKKYGEKFVEDLYKEFNAKNHKELLYELNKDMPLDLISLSTKVNINDFSNGEKQVYILCLIWAIIKSSGVEIPFIIDTPYARIDESHRNSLTNNYLPGISKQVIILSTNKEIDNNLYKVIKPHICNEYLLLYNASDRKTEVKEGYFEV